MGLRLNSIRQEREIAILYPSRAVRKQQDMAAYGACPGPLDAVGEASFVSHGLAISKISDKTYALYVVHHGVRESIEVFNLDVVPGKAPMTTWVGCIVAPDTVLLNSVVALPGGGVAATNFRERYPSWVPPVIPGFQEVFGDPLTNAGPSARGENTGGIIEWHAQSGWRAVPGSESSMPNGLEVSVDGKTLYAIVAGGKIMRISRGAATPARDVVDMGYGGDNVKWSADGKLLMVAARGAGRQTKILLIDPQSLKVVNTVDSPGPLTTAYQVGNNIWIATAPGMRIAIVPMPAAR